MKTCLASFVLVPVALMLAGCGTNPSSSCVSSAAETTISPQVATADHAAVPPGDQQQFGAFSSPSCNTNAMSNVIAKLTPEWTVSDSTNVKISSAQDTTNGLATCLGTTKGAVTVTALSGTPLKTIGTASLTCK